MPRLSGRIAFVSGGASGIGRATCHRFAQEGATVAVVDRDGIGAERVAEAIKLEGFRALPFAADITDEAQVAAVASQIRQQLGHIDLLMNSAGGSLVEDSHVIDVDMAAWNRTLDLDVKGTFLCCRATIPQMIEKGGGTIVNMSSGAALRGGSPSHIYTAAKGAIISLTRALAGTYARSSIRANAICAGRIMTDRIVSTYGRPGEAGPVEDRQNSASRIDEYPFWVGEPEDIAAIALFLSTHDSRMITGAAIPADGGRSAY